MELDTSVEVRPFRDLDQITLGVGIPNNLQVKEVVFVSLTIVSNGVTET